MHGNCDIITLPASFRICSVKAFATSYDSTKSVCFTVLLRNEPCLFSQYYDEGDWRKNRFHDRKKLVSGDDVCCKLE